jgi:hypothetical protein
MSQTSVWYLIGCAVAVAGLAWAAHLAHLPGEWIGAGVAVLIGIMVAGAAKKFGSRQQGPPPGS